MNERVRYINIRIIYSYELQEKECWYLISAEVKRLFGILGAAEVGLFLSYYDQKNQGGIFRSSHNYVHRVKAAICFIHSLRNLPIFIYSESVSGSIKKAKDLLISSKHINRYHRLKKILCIDEESSFNDDKLPD